MLLAAPGQGKTTFALNWAAEAGLRTLYCSADTDDRLVTEQLASIATGHDRESVKERLQTERWLGHYAGAIKARFPNLVVDFDSPIEIDVVAEKAEALTEVWGAFPELIVLDTASNIKRVSEDNGAWEIVWQDVQELVRFFDCTAILPHHVKQGPARSGRQAPQQSDGLFNSDKYSEIVLGLHTSAPGESTLSVLKNRGGRKDIAFQLAADMPHCRFNEPGKEVPSTSDEVLSLLGAA